MPDFGRMGEADDAKTEGDDTKACDGDDTEALVCLGEPQDIANLAVSADMIRTPSSSP